MLNPYQEPKLTDRQIVALMRLTEERMEEGDERYVLEAIFQICNPYPNSHTENTHDTAFLNGRREVNTMIYQMVETHKRQTEKAPP